MEEEKLLRREQRKYKLGKMPELDDED